MCEKDLTGVGRKGKMLHISLDHSNSICISVHVKYSARTSYQQFVLNPNCWCLSCILTSIGENLQIHVTLQLREALEYSWDWEEWSLIEIKSKKTLFIQESLNLPGGVSKAPNQWERKVSSPQHQKRQGNERTRFGLLQPWGQVGKLMVLVLLENTVTKRDWNILCIQVFLCEFLSVQWGTMRKKTIWSCLEMSTAQSTLLAHYSHQDQFASFFLGLKVFERISFPPEQCGVEHLCTIYNM